MIRLVLADDQDLVRTGLRMILDGEPDLQVVGEADNGRDAIARCRELSPDVVLMDVRMPILDGIAATRELLAPSPAIAPKVLILTTFDLDEHVYAALAAGASGFLLKDVPAAQLADAVRTVHRGEALLAPSVTRRLISRFVAQQAPTNGPSGAGLLTSLTSREREVLTLVAQGMSNAEIATRIVVGESTVKTHVGRIFAKLGVRDRAQAVIVAYEAGLVRPAA
jgi:DNA-binding NarL/FixJ family response regulator